MCGRFTLHHTTAEIAQRFGVDQPDIGLKPRYNIAPTQPVATVVQQKQDRRLDACRWGLVPFWAKDIKIGNRMINARAETLDQKPTFRAAFKYRRCIIPTSGYYEWQKRGEDGKERVPIYLHMEGGTLFGLAGLWEQWQSPDGEELHTCTIITTQATGLAASIHHRMPVILTPDAEDQWLDSAIQNPHALIPLFKSSQGPTAAHEVSKQVNVPVFDDPVCIAPAA